MAAEQFDLAVVGTGVAASTVASACREAGWSVAVIDCRPFGGTCANRGCDPKKVLVGAAELADWARRMDGRGFAAGNSHIDWPALMRFKKSFTDPVPREREQGYEAAGIRAFHGIARFEDAQTLRVADIAISAKRFVIAAGAAPARLDIPGEDLLLNSDGFLDLETMPASIVFAGGGYIAFEFAHLAERAGARVSILHRGARPLEHFDSGMVDRLVAHTRKIGIEVRLGAAVQSIETTASGFRVHSSAGPVEAQLAVHAAGRPPQIEALNLEAAGIASTARGITVNPFLQSVSNPSVYAAGDVAASGGPPLTPVAGYEGRVAAANLLHGNHRQVDYRGVASTVFTIPPLAMVGLTEDGARRQGLDYEVRAGDSSGWYSSRRIGEECSGFKVLLERPTGRLLGAHLLGESAPEVINVFALAIRNGLTGEQVKEPLYAYPTHGSDIQYMV
jgi:glutathione reductase (NADPH)